MRLAPTLALLALTATAPAFAGELTGFKITKQPEHPCSLKVARVFQAGDSGPIHAIVVNLSKDMTVGKLTAATMSGTKMVMDGSSFSFKAGAPNQTLDLIVSKDPKGPVKGADVRLAFTQCNVAMQ